MRLDFSEFHHLFHHYSSCFSVFCACALVVANTKMYSRWAAEPVSVYYWAVLLKKLRKAGLIVLK